MNESGTATIRMDLGRDVMAGLLIGCWALWSIHGLDQSTVNPFETGVYLNGARRMMAGQRIYVDFFSIYGAGTYYPFALAQWLFAKPQVAAGAVFLAFSAVNAALAYGVARRIAPRGLFALLPVIACFGGYGGGYRLTFALLCMAALFRFGQSRRPGWLFVAGALGAANLAIQQDMAAYSLAAVLVAGGATAVASLEARKVRAIVRAIAQSSMAALSGFSVVTAAWLGWMQATSSAGAYIRHAFVVPLRYYDTLRMGTIPPPWASPPLALGVVSMWARFGVDGPVRWFIYTIPFYWVPAICAFTAVWGIYRLIRGSKDQLEWTGAMVSVGAIGTFMSRSILKTGDETKLVVNALPAILLVAAWSSYWWSHRRRRTTEGAKIRLAPAAGALALASAAGVYAAYPPIQGAVKAHRRGATAAADSEEVREAGNRDVAEVARFLKNGSRSDGLFCVPNVPILYVITGRPNVTSFDYLDPIIDREVTGQLMTQLREKRPGDIVVNEGVRFWEQYEFGHEFGRDVAAYIQAEYVEVFHSGSYHVLRRSDLATQARGN